MNHATVDSLNTENEAARFDEILKSYFQASASTHKRLRIHRQQHASSNSIEEDQEKLLQQLKRLLRDAKAADQSRYIQRILKAILFQFKQAKKSPFAPKRAVELCREIFKRSSLFRALIAAKAAFFFDQLLLSAGENSSANVSKALRARCRESKQLMTVLTLIETWQQDFGHKYPSLVAGYSVLVERGYIFPHEREKKQNESEHKEATDTHHKRLNQAKKQQRDREMKRIVPEMEHVLIEMHQVFEILVPTLDSLYLENSDEVKSVEAHETEEEEEIEWESVNSENEEAPGDNYTHDCDSKVGVEAMDMNEIVQAYGLGSSSYRLTIEISKNICEESSENDALFKILADGALCIRKRFMPILKDWEQHSTLEKHSSQSQRDVLKRIKHLQDQMTRALLQWEDLSQGSRHFQQEKAAVSAIVSMPLDSYKLPMKRKQYQ